MKKMWVLGALLGVTALVLAQAGDQSTSAGQRGPWWQSDALAQLRQDTSVAVWKLASLSTATPRDEAAVKAQATLVEQLRAQLAAKTAGERPCGSGACANCPSGGDCANCPNAGSCVAGSQAGCNGQGPGQGRCNGNGPGAGQGRCNGNGPGAGQGRCNGNGPGGGQGRGPGGGQGQGRGRCGGGGCPWRSN